MRLPNEIIFQIIGPVLKRETEVVKGPRIYSYWTWKRDGSSYLLNPEPYPTYQWKSPWPNNGGTKNSKEKPKCMVWKNSSIQLRPALVLPNVLEIKETD